MRGETYLQDVVTLQLNQEKCTGCTLCIKVCPHAVFVMENKIAKMVNRDLCMECGACALNCPANAIYVKSGVGCAAGIISGILNNSEPACSCSGSSTGCC